tara:strand:- start:3983 stop:4285 length:303 start_codon:yes stop_codon:yes gene_type:complete
MANYDGAKMKKKVKSLSFEGKIDALSRTTLRFTGLNGRNQGKIHGKGSDGYNRGSGCATIDDVLHTMGCDLFGSTRYNITIQVQEIPDAQKKKRAEKKVS